MADHAYWSASNFESIMLCPGKIVLEQGAPDNTNQYAAEGTAAHLILTFALEQGVDASAFIGRVIHLDSRGKPCELVDAEYEFEVDEEMAEHVQVCVDYVRDLAGHDGTILVDQRVNYSEYLGVDWDRAWGTLDVIVFRGDEIIVIDFKYGRGVEVSAEQNPQVSLYAFGALQTYDGVIADFNRVRLAISQPRVKKAPSEWDCTVDELNQWRQVNALPAVVRAEDAVATKGNPGWEEAFLKPGEKQCKFCKAKATCPALRNEVLSTVIDQAPASVDEFEAMMDTRRVDADSLRDTPEQWLSFVMSKVDLIEEWCKSIRAETERRLLAGSDVPGFKLVAGRKGPRNWVSAAAAEEALKAMRLKQDQMYDMKLISPTTAEKLAKKEVIGPRQWKTLQELVTQKQGSPSVAPVSDSRPALVITPVADDFDVIAEPNLA